MRIKENDKIVFAGDSITEDGRFTDPEGLGQGYVRLIHHYFQEHVADQHIQIVNKGISGNRITDLRERWNEDMIKEDPDWLSISIGINDVWRQLDKPEIEQVDPGQFEHIYRKLLTKTKEQTNAKIIILAPTIIGENARSSGNSLLKAYVEITKKLAVQFNTIYVPLHDTFIHHIEQADHEPLTTDGVHMNDAGRELMAKTWIDYMNGTLASR